MYTYRSCLALGWQGEEAALDWTFCWSGEQPVVEVVLGEEERREGEEELSDHQLVQVDTLAALLRMDILPRLRYILTVSHWQFNFFILKNSVQY